MTQKSYEAVTRTPGSFDAAWHGINLLQEKKVPFVVKSALLPPNKAELAEFEAWAATVPWMDKPPSYSIFFDFRCRRDSEEKNRLVRKLRLSPEEGLSVLTRARAKYHREMQEFCTKFTRPPGDRLFSCGASAVILDGNGLLFVGHSEAGKSTIASMLRDRAEILCDDRMGSGSRHVESWRCTSPSSAPLKAIMFLEQGVVPPARDLHVHSHSTAQCK